jgi:hypothetical protein
MDFPSEVWIYDDTDDFETAPSSKVKGDYILEIYSQLLTKNYEIRLTLPGNRCTES